MLSTDPIADMLTRLRNVALIEKRDLSIPYSKIKEQIALILQQQGFIGSVKCSGDGKEKVIQISLSDTARITEIQRISKPGRRVYVDARSIPVVKNGRGIVVVSTSKGLMTGNDAQKEKIGGEVVCSVY